MLGNRLFLGLALVACAPLMGAVIGDVDNFEDGTTQGWVVNLLGMGVHPAPPVNVATGGPAGSGDNYLKLTSAGGAGAGSRLAAINLGKWAGNYLAAGINAISMDLINLGATDLNIRLYLENPMGAPPTDDALTTAVFLPSGGTWTRVVFSVASTDLTAVQGNVNTLLSNVTAIRILHSPGTSLPVPAIAAQLGVDNITATPEPYAGLLVGAGLVALGLLRRR